MGAVHSMWVELQFVTTHAVPSRLTDGAAMPSPKPLPVSTRVSPRVRTAGSADASCGVSWASNEKAAGDTVVASGGGVE
eukprot:scaffold25307_cov109-Isochrysis_galbana.AAC.15